MGGTGSRPVTPVPAAERSRKPKTSIRLLLVGTVVLAIAAGGGYAWYRGSRTADADARPAPAEYLALSPPFVANLGGVDGGPRYLQVEVQLVARDAAAVPLLRHHEPALRARLLMLFAQQTHADVADRAGKEALQARALAEVRELMIAETGQPQADALLFTSFVTQ